MVGRRPGVRNRFSHAFLSDFLADWQQNGPAAIKIVRTRDPGRYLSIAAQIVPKEVMVEAVTSGLTADERIEMIAAIKQHLLMRQQDEPMLIEAKINEPELSSDGNEQASTASLRSGNGAR